MGALIRYVVVAMLLISSAVPAFAQRERVVEASAKRRATWIGCFDKSSITITEQGATLTEASEKALASIYQHIINAVAVNVTSSERLLSKTVSYDNLHSAMSDYSSTLMTEAARIPYLCDISLTNATDIYWEKIYERKSKSYRYEYSVRYPFDEAMRQKLVAEFVAIDNAKSAELQALREELNTLTDLDRVGQVLNALDVLHGYFFDDVRRGETLAVKRDFQALYSRIRIEVERQEPGRCLFSLRLSGRRVTTSVPVRLRSTSALNMSVSSVEGGCYELSYDPSYASPRDINTIEIIYLFGGRRVEKIIYFDAPQRATRKR